MASSEPLPFVSRPSRHDSRRVFGAGGFRVSDLKRSSKTAMARFDRYREPLEDLNDRQLIRRYHQYLRGADRAEVYVDATGGSDNAVGLRAQMLGRLMVAVEMLRARGIPVPSREEAHLHPRAEEIYVENAELHGEIDRWEHQQILEELGRVEVLILEDPADPVLHQRAQMLTAHVGKAERVEEALTSDLAVPVDEHAYAILRERLVYELSGKLGYWWTESEADLVLESIGVHPTTAGVAVLEEAS